ncbi:TPA: transcriptional regulator [Photobacterium damselae]
MSDLFTILFNLRSLRTQSQKLTLEQLQEGLAKLAQVTNERAQEKDQLQAKNKEKEEKLAMYRKMLIVDGISPEELLGKLQKQPTPNKRLNRPAKSHYTNDNGEEKT